MAEKLNDLFACVFIMKVVGHVTRPKQLFSGAASEELSQIEMIRDDVLNPLGGFKKKNSPGLDGQSFSKNSNLKLLIFK